MKLKTNRLELDSMLTNYETIAGSVQHRRGTTEEWIKSNFIPAEGELVIEECANGIRRGKVGDGTHTFNDLSYIDAAVEAELDILANRLDKHILDNKLTDTAVTNLKREVEGISSAVQNLVQPSIDSLDVKYSAKLAEIEKRQTADFEELSGKITENVSSLETTFGTNLTEAKKEVISALDSKAAELTTKYNTDLKLTEAALNKQLVDIKTKQQANETSIGTLDTLLKDARKSLAESVKRLDAEESSINSLNEEVTRLKELGFGDIVTSEMIGKIKAIESKVEQLHTNDINVVAKMYEVDSALTRTSRQLEDLKKAHATDKAALASEFSSIKEELYAADEANLAKLNEEFTKLWAEITDLVDDDISLYESIATTRSQLNNQFKALKTAVEQANNDLKDEFTKTLTDIDSSVKSFVEENLDSITETIKNNKNELTQRANDLQKEQEYAARSFTASMQTLGEEVESKYTDVLDRVTKVADDLVENKTQTDGAFSDIDKKLTQANRRADNLDTKIAIERERIDSQARQINQFVRLEEGSTTGDAELINARTGKDGKEYATVGEHIREIESNLMQHVDTDAISGLYYDTPGEVGLGSPYMLYLKNAKGEIIPNTGVQIISGAGGGPGGSTSSKLTIRYVFPLTTEATFKASDKVELIFNFSGEDSSGDYITQADAEWYINGVLKTRSKVRAGDNKFDVTNYLTGSETTVFVKVRDANGTTVTKEWQIKRVDLDLKSDFNDKKAYAVGESFVLSYEPTGDIEKKLSIILDGELLRYNNDSEADYTVKLSSGASGQVLTYENVDAFTSLTHGVHTLEMYLKADINEFDTVCTESVFKEIIVVDSTSTLPLISITKPPAKISQYNTVNIIYTVYDPKKELPVVDIYLDDSSTPIVRNKEIPINSDYKDTPTAVYPYNALEAGSHKITIVCGNNRRSVDIEVESVDTDLSPVVDGLAFDFNPALCDNSSEWEYQYQGTTITMTRSENFDYTNGGYRVDENGDQYFCVKAGTSAQINYKLFADNAKDNGKEFKVIFKTTNVRQRNTSFLKCLDSNIGIDMRVENATIYDGSSRSLRTDYCEDTIIEYEFNINAATDMPIVMSYEDGTPSKPYEYTSSSSFTQPANSQQSIIIGSDDCDVHIYRMKVYNRSLRDAEIKNNFIADARSLDEKLARYNRNAIYDDGKLVTTSASGDFSAKRLMEAAPDLRYIFLEVPQFTKDKDNKIDGCTVHFRYPAGTRPQDNWTCTGVRHRGQGTSSNAYGYAGRNLDLCMDRDESLFTWEEQDDDGNTITKTGRKITLTDTSVPTDYLNIKVNIASSENANNAELARRFNNYQPFLRYARKKDSRVKDTMEFYNCVVFIRETSVDTTTIEHREFNDNNWHFYAIGNIGDSKKTDDTRVNDASDPKEHIVEIMDVDVPLAAFPEYLDKCSYTYHDSTGQEKTAKFESTVSTWASGNAAYDVLHSNDFNYDDEEIGEFKSFGGKSFEFRYEKSKITDDQRIANINAWRNFYDFVVTSSDEDFHANLKNYFAVDSALYYYLFTERYTMVDNRAKNSFWHYGKVYISEEKAAEIGDAEASYYIIDNEAAAINDGYRYDLTFGYDMDTALGIDNTGDYVFGYGKEDTDYYRDNEPTSGPAFRANNSTFFCKLRDLFRSELRTMFQNRENVNAWNANSLIEQWDNSQSKFPEELWRLDYERKYYRTYRGISIDNSIAKAADKQFLKDKFFGRKKYARRAFESNQEIYFATKYFGKAVAADTNAVWIRGTTNNGQQNYSITITPYLDMYPLIKYGSAGNFQHGVDENDKPIRLKAGQSYTFEDDADSRDFIYIGAPDWIQVIGDLSKCYIDDSSFANAKRLQRLTLGDSTEGYTNANLKSISVDSNALLEYLDLSNITGLEGDLDLKANVNLKTLKALGTNISGIEFAPGGKISQVELPETIIKITLKDLKYLSANPPSGDPSVSYFSLPNDNNVQTLVIENCPNFTLADVLGKFSCTDNSGNRVLKNIRLTKMSFGNYTYNDFITEFDGLGGVDINGNKTDTAWLDGTIHFTGTLTGEQYNYVSTRYPELKITYDELKSVLMFRDNTCECDVKLDCDHKLAEDQLIIDNPEVANDNNGELPDCTPEKDSTDEFSYDFVGWSAQKNFIIGEEQIYNEEVLNNTALNNIIGDRILYPVFKERRNIYTVTFINPNSNGEAEELMQVSVPYGDELVYSGETPIKLDPTGSASLYTFTGWADDKGKPVDYVTSNITVYAQFTIEDDTWYTLTATDITSNIVDGKLAIITCINPDERNKAVRIPQSMDVGSGNYEVFSVGGFKGYTALELLELPETITKITNSGYDTVDFGAFTNCYNLADINLPDALQTISPYAFSNCTSLKDIFIPASVTKIGSGAFAHCNGLISIRVAESNLKYSVKAGCLIEAGTNTVIHGLAPSEPSKEYEIPANINVKVLGPYCFAKRGIKNIKIPEGVTEIQVNAFSSCTELTTVTLPTTLQKIISSSFSGCTKLTSVNLSEASSLLEIGTFAFSKCALSSIVLPSSVNKIDSNAFGGMTSINTVTFTGKTLLTAFSTIDKKAFENSTVTQFNVPWSKDEHIIKFGSSTETWGATGATLNFDYKGD
jgi:hypothetical protein